MALTWGLKGGINMSQVRKVKRGSRRKVQQELRTEGGKVGRQMQRRKASQVYSET